MSQQTVSLLVGLLIVALVLWRRSRALSRPLRGNGWTMLLLPAVFVLLLPTVFLGRDGHFASPAPAWELLLAVLLGLVFAAPLVWLTAYERRDDGLIYLRQNRALLVAFAALVVVRLGLRFVLTDLDPVALNALFFLVAITYVVVWRVASFVKYRRVHQNF